MFIIHILPTIYGNLISIIIIIGIKIIYITTVVNIILIGFSIKTSIRMFTTLEITNNIILFIGSCNTEIINTLFIIKLFKSYLHLTLKTIIKKLNLLQFL